MSTINVIDNITIVDNDDEVIAVISKDEIIIKDGYKVLEDVGVENRRIKMEYTKDTMVDGTVYERFEGTPQEIIEVVNGIDNEDSGLVYDQDDAMDFIRLRLKKDHEAEITEGLLRAILDLEEDYMRSVGIIED